MNKTEKPNRGKSPGETSFQTFENIKIYKTLDGFLDSAAEKFKQNYKRALFEDQNPFDLYIYIENYNGETLLFKKFIQNKLTSFRIHILMELH